MSETSSTSTSLPSPTGASVQYVGRFAPSPSGPLHFGSLVCAVGSYLDAIAHGGRWLVRMEDLDPPREMPGAAEWILQSLQAHGLHWHGPVVWQSQRHGLYAHALEQLQQRNLIYRCGCSRAQIKRAGGHQRAHCVPPAPENSAAVRFACGGGSSAFDDLWRGHQSQVVTGDPILKRRDGLFAYQLAVVVDDIDQGITHVVRGADLLDCTGVQLRLFRAFGATAPVFGHLPLVMNTGGQKLSKQNHATALDDRTPSKNLMLALDFLGFKPPPGLGEETPARILSWAGAHWQRQQVDGRNRLLC